jgi:serine-type D-Ala-D-Ala carboxypeptidase/endopeptidase
VDSAADTAHRIASAGLHGPANRDLVTAGDFDGEGVPMRFDGMILAAALLVPATAASASANDHIAATADDPAIVADVVAVMVDRSIPGAQVAIVMRDDAIWERSFGVRDLASSAPMTADTLIQVGSVTKIFTASLISELVAERAVNWSDSLGERLPGVVIRTDLADITLDELLTHTARLPANPPNRVDVDGIMQPYSIAQLYASLSDPAVKLVQPGRAYSNWGYALLGHVAEKAAGKRLEEMLRERIFEPLGMTSSKIKLSAADERRLAVHYWPEDKPLVPRPSWIFGEVAGFGGITSTAGDLAKFLRHQIRPERRTDVLDAAGIQSLRTVRTLGSNWQVGGSRGWLVVRDPDGTVTIEHSGEVDGHSSYIGFSPDYGVGVAVAANLGGSSAREVALPLLSRTVAQTRQSLPLDREKAMGWAKQRQWADAEAALVKVTAALPADGQAWHELGLARYELHDLPGAEAALVHAAKKTDNPKSSLFMLAVIAASQGRIDTAFKRLAQAVDAVGQNPDLRRPELRILQSDSRWAKLLAKTTRNR